MTLTEELSTQAVAHQTARDAALPDARVRRWWHHPPLHLLVAAPLAVFIVLSTVLIGGVTTTMVPTALADVPGQTAPKLTSSVVTLTNEKRAQHSRALLRRQRCLERFAQRQARRLARIHRLEHQPLKPIMRRCKVWSAGENLAMGYADARGAVRGWMHSPSHRFNMLYPKYRLIGVGAAQDHQGIWWVAQVFGRS
ncbi:CAP domain-containing protein [Nocardioides sp. GY 10113]|uniref:CAP domain-containing protein n=1 Tax=Nocardioides sp. GY 10113 TaxID=2569761 RepID=UPI0010A86983|nr:CAP domain-containing protein [Nocardioides sp. GY 10113]TIC87534.1 CAP domain-containing protein [Nocardioides sp. GY 10113]